jgi:hypothetical protein
MAGIAFNVDYSDLVRLAQAIPGAEVILSEELELVMDDSGMALTTMTAARTPVNYGLLRSAIANGAGFERQGNVLDELRGIVGANSAVSMSGAVASTYVWYVEEDTAPHWAPVAPLKLWAMRKLGDERAAWRIRFKIAHQGTKGKHMFRRAWDEGGSELVTRLFNLVPERALRRWEGTV